MDCPPAGILGFVGVSATGAGTVGVTRVGVLVVVLGDPPPHAVMAKHPKKVDTRVILSRHLLFLCIAAPYLLLTKNLPYDNGEKTFLVMGKSVKNAIF
jgi:hypothetical protein